MRTDDAVADSATEIAIVAVVLVADGVFYFVEEEEGNYFEAAVAEASELVHRSAPCSRMMGSVETETHLDSTVPVGRMY